MSIKAPRGTEDILPGEIEKWQRIEKTARELFPLYNYREIRTPLFEDTSLFERSIGESTDIVEKEMYTFLDKKGRSLTLRPEGTAPVVRAYLEHKLYAKGGINKFFYTGAFFRYERPQAGRNRQFYQVGVEAIGSDSPAIDAEVISLSLHFLSSLGLGDFLCAAERQVPESEMRGLHVALNSIGCSSCQPIYREKLRQFLNEHTDELCEDCRRRTESNPLRVLDCKKEACISVLKSAPLSLDFLCTACREHFESVTHFLDILGINYQVAPHLVRGLDYYTRTTFEIIYTGLGAQNAVVAGGRFDGLIEEMGGNPTPAVGFAAGIERIALAMDGEGVKITDENGTLAFIALAGKEYLEEGMLLLSELRRSAISAEMDYEGRSLKSQFRLADRLGVKFTIILGKDGLVLRDMKEYKLEEMKRQEVIPFLRKKLERDSQEEEMAPLKEFG